MQIKITDITPFMRKGWVAMDEDGCWTWFANKPKLSKSNKVWVSGHFEWEEIDLSVFKPVAPADDWTKSLIKIDNTAREKFEKEYQNNIQKTIQELQDV
jgi:hypothetical protein